MVAPAEMECILDHAEVGILVICSDFLEHVDAMKLLHLRTVLVLDSTDDPAGRRHFATWARERSVEDANIESTLDDICYQLCTFGATGLPKGVAASNRSLVQQMASRCDVWNFDAAIAAEVELTPPGS